MLAGGGTMGCEYALGCIHRFIESEIGVLLFSVFMVGEFIRIVLIY